MNIIQQKQYLATKLGVDYKNLSQSFLRREIELKTQNRVNFGLTKANSDRVQIITENLLDTNDQFVITHLAFAFKKVVPAGAEITNAEHLQAKLHRTPSPLIFDGAAEAVSLPAVYNGELSIKTNNKTYSPSMPMFVFERNYTQQHGTGNAANRAEQRSALEGFFAIDPIKITGTDKLSIVVDWKESLNFVQADENNYLVCLVAGYLVSNEN